MRDALVQPATPEQVAAFALRNGTDSDAARRQLEELRERQLRARESDPFLYGYEPPIWYVTKALMRNPYWSDYERKTIARWGAEKHEKDLTAERFSEMMRKRLGFEYPVTKVLVMGSNRSGKTDFSAKLCMQACRTGNKYVGSGAQTLKTQKQNQMARVWKYMPNDWKRQNIATTKAKDVVENISYTPKNGFANSKITFKNGSIMSFISYEQTIASQEGVEYDLVHLDEEYGIEHYNLFTTRVTSRAGIFLGTFTPLHGYTPQVAKFLEGAVTTRWHAAYLRPKDGGEKMPWLELGLERDEYERLVAWRREGMQGDCGIRESVPENCFEWLLDEGEGRDLAEGARGREFDYTPRVAVCQGGQAAAIWFYGSDNPYGLPSELILTKMADENAEKRILESVYGVAKDMKGMLLRTFSRERNVVRDCEIPEKLVRIMVADPAPERNWCMLWLGLDPETRTLYATDEWPGDYEIPGQGVPGEWVVASDKNGGMNDGARGDAQQPFGFGYDHIKFEIARRERWNDYEEWRESEMGERADERGERSCPARMPDDMSIVEDWSDENGAGLVMAFRIIDSRAAAQSKINKTSSQSLLSDLDGMMNGWTVADGQKCEVGYNLMIDRFASGKIKISDKCRNLISCIEMLTGKDGQKGAAKDFVDLLRYAAMSDIWDWNLDRASEDRAQERRTAEHYVGERTFSRSRGHVWW